MGMSGTTSQSSVIIEHAFVQDLLKRGFNGDVPTLLAQLLSQPEFEALDHTKLKNAILFAADKAREVEPGVPKLHAKFDTISLDHIREGLKLDHLHPGMAKVKVSGSGAEDKLLQFDKKSFANQAANSAEHAHYNKISMAVGLIAAGFSALGAVSALSNSVQKDAAGENKIEWTNVGIGLAEAAFAAGVAYLTLKQPKIMQTLR